MPSIPEVGQFVWAVMFKVAHKGAGLFEQIDVFSTQPFDAMQQPGLSIGDHG